MKFSKWLFLVIVIMSILISITACTGSPDSDPKYSPAAKKVQLAWLSWYKDRMQADLDIQARMKKSISDAASTTEALDAIYKAFTEIADNWHNDHPEY